MGERMAYEALNKRLIVIFNDNEMLIALPMGAMSSYLSKLSAKPKFQDIRALSAFLLQFLPLR
jgi:1-deoxy-D-xylulose-5-phosphate synthase